MCTVASSAVGQDLSRALNLRLGRRVVAAERLATQHSRGMPSSCRNQRLMRLHTDQNYRYAPPDETNRESTTLRHAAC